MNTELYHYGVKGMKWGRRRYINQDGSLTPAGKKKYRKAYDDVKLQYRLSERSNSTNSTGVAAFDKYNSRYYEKVGKNKLKMLTRKIGDKGLSQLDEDVINEGKAIANKGKKQAEELNRKYNLDKKDPFWVDPQKRYDYDYNRYLDSNLLKR